MKRCNRVLMGLLFCGLVLIIGMFLIQGVSASTSIYEQQNPYFGNQLDAVSFAYAPTSPTGSTQGTFFRTNCSIEVNKVCVYFSAIFGSWAGKVQKVGLRGLDANGDPLNTWLGATGNGWVNITPVGSTCIIATLREKVTLADDTVYFLAINDSARVHTAVVYFVTVVSSNDIGSVKTRPSNGFLEPYDMHGIKLTTTWDKSKGILFGWAVLNSSSGLIIGNGYVTFSAGTVYLTRPRRQNFNVSSDVMVDGLDIPVKQVANAISANDSLHVEVYYASNNSLLASGSIDSKVTMKMLATGHCRWVKTFFSPVWLRAGIPYYFKLWTKAPSTSAYSVYVLGTINGNATFMSCKYGGVSCASTSTDNGSSWSAVSYQDIPFRFHRIPVVNIVNNNVNVTGTSTSSYNTATQVTTVTNTFSSPLVWFLHAINSTLTHQQSWTGSQMNLYVNSSGNLTAIHVSDVKNNVTGSVSYTQNSTGYWVTSSHESTLTQFLNLINATGTHQKVWTGSTWNDWANVTGNSSGSSALSLSVINPNPGNGTHQIEASGFGVGGNYLKANSSGLTTSLDVTDMNFTIPPEGPISTTVVISSDADDGETGLAGANYNAVWSSSTGVVGDTGFSILLGQFKVGSTYFMDRGFFFFDTSSIPSDAIIDSSKLTFVLFNDGSTTDFDITIQNGQPTYPHKPLVVGDFNKAFYSGDGGNFNTAGLPVAGNPFDINLNALGLTWINKGGTTKFSIRSSREIAGIKPTGIERINIYTFEQGTTYIPKLNITYQVPGVYSNWSNCLNVSWLSNSSGTWLEYAHSAITSNGTVTVPALNFSGAGTYWWKAVCESNHHTWFNTSVFQFTTIGNPTCNSTNLTVNEFNTNVTGGYTSLYNPLTGWIVNNSYIGVTTPLHQFENIVNAVGTHTFLLNGTGYWDWANYSSDLGTSENIINATGTHQYRWNGSSNKWWVWANYTGNTTPVTLFQNFINATGTHVKQLGSVGWSVWANVTGNASSSVNVTRWLPLNMGVFGGSTMMLVLFSLMAMCTAILGARRRKRKQQY